MTLMQTPHSKPRATGRKYTEVWKNLGGGWMWHCVSADGLVLGIGREGTQEAAYEEAKAVYDRD